MLFLILALFCLFGAGYAFIASQDLAQSEPGWGRASIGLGVAGLVFLYIFGVSL